jgi:hypothetical protein
MHTRDFGPPIKDFISGQISLRSVNPAHSASPATEAAILLEERPHFSGSFTRLYVSKFEFPRNPRVRNDSGSRQQQGDGKGTEREASRAVAGGWISMREVKNTEKCA